MLLWVRLRIRNPELPNFRRQHPISPYITDFYCAAARLVVEVDGSTHGEEARIAYDEVRDRYLQKLGYHILRVSAAEVMADADKAADGIMHTALGLIPKTRSAADAPSVTRR